MAANLNAFKKLQKMLRFNQLEKKKDKTASFLENGSEKKYSSSSQSSKTKPRRKLVLVSREPLLHLEFNKINKQNIYEIILI